MKGYKELMKNSRSFINSKRIPKTSKLEPDWPIICKAAILDHGNKKVIELDSIQTISLKMSPGVNYEECVQTFENLLFPPALYQKGTYDMYLATSKAKIVVPNGERRTFMLNDFPFSSRGKKELLLVRTGDASDATHSVSERMGDLLNFSALTKTVVENRPKKKIKPLISDEETSEPVLIEDNFIWPSSMSKENREAKRDSLFGSIDQISIDQILGVVRASKPTIGFIHFFDLDSNCWKRMPMTVDDFLPPNRNEKFEDGGFKLVFGGGGLKPFFQDKICVWKVAKEVKEDNFAAHCQDVHIMAVSQKVGREFQKKVGGAEVIRFLESVLVEFTENPEMYMQDLGRFWMVEEQITNAEFIKYMDNDGWYQDKMLQHQLRDFDYAVALMHFSYVFSSKEFMIADIQGANLTFTDCQILTANNKDFGGGNIGLIGIEKLLKNHSCNWLCKKCIPESEWLTMQVSKATVKKTTRR